MMFFKKSLQPPLEEYKTINKALSDQERLITGLQLKIEALETKFKSFEGRFWQHVGKEEETGTESKKGDQKPTGLTSSFNPGW